MPIPTSSQTKNLVGEAVECCRQECPSAQKVRQLNSEDVPISRLFEGVHACTTHLGFRLNCLPAGLLRASTVPLVAFLLNVGNVDSKDRRYVLLVPDGLHFLHDLLDCEGAGHAHGLLLPPV